MTAFAAPGARRSIRLVALVDGNPAQAAIEWESERDHANPPYSNGSWSIQRSARSHPAAPVLMERQLKTEGIRLLARVTALESERRFLQAIPSAIDDCLSWARSATPPTSAPSFAGHYRITGVIESDGCGGRVHLAAQHIDVSLDGKLLTADVVNRRYDAHLDGDRLVASLAAQPTSAAPSAREPLAESWSFQHASDGGLAGLLSGKWQLQGAPAPCEIRHRITATPELIDPTL